MDKEKYVAVDLGPLPGSEDGVKEAAKNIQLGLNHFGSLGWNFVQLVPAGELGSFKYILIFKRPDYD